MNNKGRRIGDKILSLSNPGAVDPQFKRLYECHSETRRLQLVNDQLMRVNRDLLVRVKALNYAIEELKYTLETERIRLTIGERLRLLYKRLMRA